MCRIQCIVTVLSCYLSASPLEATWPDRLPERNAAISIPGQPWPHDPRGLVPRNFRVLVHYPGGTLESVSPDTGIMLSLHNWGGEDCAGTASPGALAKRLNVVALCVNYLQSGHKASIDDPEPYDCGYLQSLDALRALWFVRDQLRRSQRAYDDGRIYCTGGSGGGNVTLMANKLAPRTFACVIDMCGMKKLSDDIAFNLPGGTGLNARWSRDPDSPNYLSPDAQAIRYIAHPEHAAVMRKLNPTAKIVVVHGVHDRTCPFEDAQELVTNFQTARLDVEPHFITKDDLDGKAFTSSGHALGNRTEIVFRVAGRYLSTSSPDLLRRDGPTDFDRRETIAYPTPGGAFRISYEHGYPVGLGVER